MVLFKQVIRAYVIDNEAQRQKAYGRNHHVYIVFKYVHQQQPLFGCVTS